MVAKFRLFFLVLCCSISLSAYDFGYGYELNDNLTAGGYLASKYKHTPNKEEIELDDVALLLYGDLSDKLSFLIELESAGTYIHRLDNGQVDESLDFKLERGYLQYLHNDLVEVRVGKFMTPVGLWNLIPIVVFREIAQKPRISTELFPKFTTGLELKLKTDTIDWDIIAQNNDDIDKDYNNFHVKEHYGVKATYRYSDTITGGNIGWFYDESLALKSTYLGWHYKIDKEMFKVLSEAYYTNLKYEINKVINGYSSKDFDKKGLFIQSTYKHSHAIHFNHRYEIFQDEMQNADLGYSLGKYEHINVLGVHYRPLSNISLKMEYQVSSFKKDDEIAVVSFSVLF